VTVFGVLCGFFFFIISILTIILLFLSASVSRIVFYVVIVFCAAIVRNKLLINSFKNCLERRRTRQRDILKDELMSTSPNGCMIIKKTGEHELEQPVQ